LWTASRANGSPSANGGASTYLGLKIFMFKKWGAEPTRGWARPAGLGRPTQAHPGPVLSPLHSRGSSCLYALCLSNCTILTMSSSRPRWMFFLHEVRSFMLQSLGMFLVTLRSLPPLGVISSSS
jgi:hypothetical protein